MTAIFNIVILLAFLAIIVGLVKPGFSIFWVKKPNRIKVMIIYLGIILVCLLLYQPPQSKKENKVVSKSQKKESTVKAEEAINRDLVLKTKFMKENVQLDIKLSAKVMVRTNDNKVPNKKELLATARHIGSLYETKNKFIEFYLPKSKVVDDNFLPFAIYAYNSESASKYLLNSSKTKENITIYSNRIPDMYHE